MQARPAPRHSVRLQRRPTRHLRPTTTRLLPIKRLKIPTVRHLTMNHLRATVLLCRTRLPRTPTALQFHPTKSLTQDTASRRTKLLLQAIMLPLILSAFPLIKRSLRDTVLHLSKLPETLVAQVWIHLVASILPMASLRIPTLFHASRKIKT